MDYSILKGYYDDTAHLGLTAFQSLFITQFCEVDTVFGKLNLFLSPGKKVDRHLFS
jgi:hypothetical protein